MSSIVVLKESDSIVLGTDSRYVTADRTRIASDSVEKIQEIAPDTFLATSGYSPVCDFQNAKARELGQSTQDIRTLSGTLAEASRPILEEVAAALARDAHLHADIASAVAGDVVLHGAVLAGRSRGELGYVYMESRCAGGRVVTQIQEHFGAQRQITITSATDSDCLIAQFRRDHRLWSDPPVSVINLILDAMKKASTAIGGPTQAVRLDGAGSHWISRLPGIRKATCAQGIGTIRAAITMTAPTLVIAPGTFTVNIDGTNGVKITDASANYLQMIQAALEGAANRSGSSLWLGTDKLDITYSNLANEKGEFTLGTALGGGGSYLDLYDEQGSLAVGIVSGLHSAGPSVTLWSPTLGTCFGQNAVVSYAKPGGGSGTMTFVAGWLVAFT